jgi:hypothetical protein
MAPLAMLLCGSLWATTTDGNSCGGARGVDTTGGPQFTTRNVEYFSSCLPHQLYVGATVLRAEVLAADEPQAKASPTTTSAQ